MILDINLPDVNGFAVCSKLRENADTPILIVSARTDKADKRTALTWVQMIISKSLMI